MNILVTGANGQLGHEMQKVAKNSVNNFVFTDVAEGYEKLDITNLDAIRKMVKDNDIQLVVNCAAYTNVDKAESDYDMANLLNNTAAANLAQAMKEVEGILIHVSTDYVFQGDKNIPCREDWETNPLGVYGKTKLAGEQSIIATGCKYIIIRTAWLYSQWGKNFVKTMQNLTATHDTLKVVFDQTGTPTYAWDLATAIVAALRTPVEGIYHYSNEGVCSWYDFTKEIYRQAGYRTEVIPISTEEYGLSKAARPFNSRLDKSKLVEAGFTPLPTWQDALSRYLKEIEQ